MPLIAIALPFPLSSRRPLHQCLSSLSPPSIAITMLLLSRRPLHRCVEEPSITFAAVAPPPLPMRQWWQCSIIRAAAVHCNCAAVCAALPPSIASPPSIAIVMLLLSCHPMHQQLWFALPYRRLLRSHLPSRLRCCCRPTVHCISDCDGNGKYCAAAITRFGDDNHDNDCHRPRGR